MHTLSSKPQIYGNFYVVFFEQEDKEVFTYCKVRAARAAR